VSEVSRSKKYSDPCGELWRSGDHVDRRASLRPFAALNRCVEMLHSCTKLRAGNCITGPPTDCPCYRSRDRDVDVPSRGASMPTHRDAVLRRIVVNSRAWRRAQERQVREIAPVESSSCTWAGVVLRLTSVLAISTNEPIGPSTVMRSVIPWPGSQHAGSAWSFCRPRLPPHEVELVRSPAIST